MDTESFDLLLNTVQRFVQERLIPAEQQVEEENAIPDDLADEIRELGLFGLAIAEEYGGLGLSMEEEVRVALELGQTSPAFRSLVGTNIGIGSQSIIMTGTEEQKKHYLPRLATGELIGSFALTEPDAGSDALSIKTTAKRDGNDYVLNGTKRYITNAPVAGLFTVMARTGEGRSADAISCFLIDKDQAGLTLGKPDKKMGQRGALTCDVILDNCRVPASALLGAAEGNGFRTAMKVLDKGRLHIAAICVGMAERLIRESVNFAVNREQFGQKISDFQLVQAMIADSKADTLAAKALVMETARLRDNKQRITLQAAAAKMFSSEMLGRIADRAVQIHGGAGYMSEYPVEHFYRDARLFRIYEGTTQIQQLIIARETIAEIVNQS